jgi:hypothetical protein
MLVLIVSYLNSTTGPRDRIDQQEIMIMIAH